MKAVYIGTLVLSAHEVTNAHVGKMAKSLRSKRKRKLRAVKREKNKIKEDKRLKIIVGSTKEKGEDVNMGEREDTEREMAEESPAPKDESIAGEGDGNWKCYKGLYGRWIGQARVAHPPYITFKTII